MKYSLFFIAAFFIHVIHLNGDNSVIKKKQQIVFLITEDPDNYEAHKTVPKFARMLEEKYGYDATVLLGSGGHGSYSYPHMEILSKADLLVVFARRIALPHEQMNAIKNYIKKGKPVIGIRTANHAFTVREKVEDGFEDWPEFVADVVGCENRGYGPVEPGAEVSVVSDAINNSIVKDIASKQWHSEGNVYLVAPLLDKKATILLTGKVNDISQPIAWTRTAGKSKVFYTSLGYPTDFETPGFIQLIVNAIKWSLS
jgi:type 1 glutamine amidotransferase